MEDSKDIDNILPVQTIGTSLDVVEKRITASADEAKFIFNRAKERLLNVNDWGKLAEISSFQIITAKGLSVQRKVEELDYIRIDIPGPGTHAGMGYDWVQVENIVNLNDNEQNFIAMTVRPSAHPLEPKGEIAHFLKDTATSTFVIRKDGLEVFAEEHGRNEVANTDSVKILDRGRNFAVGLAAKIGLSYPQWKNLVKAFLAD